MLCNTLQSNLSTTQKKFSLETLGSTIYRQPATGAGRPASLLPVRRTLLLGCREAALLRTACCCLPPPPSRGFPAQLAVVLRRQLAVKVPRAVAGAQAAQLRDVGRRLSVQRGCQQVRSDVSWQAWQWEAQQCGTPSQ